MFRINIAWLALIGCVAPITNARADLLPPGHKSVKHEMVFVESEPLSSHRIIATPTRGFSGVEEIEPGKPFRFSSKYGTRLYSVPENIELPKKFDLDFFEQWPSCDPPVRETKSVPIVSPVKSKLTTVRLASVSPDGLIIEVVSDESFDWTGKPANVLRFYWPLFVPVFLGGTLCFWMARRKRARKNADAEPDRQADTV